MYSKAEVRRSAKTVKLSSKRRVFILQSLDAEIAHFKEFVRTFEDYENSLLKQRRENAQKERELEKSRVCMMDSNKFFSNHQKGAGLL